MNYDLFQWLTIIFDQKYSDSTLGVINVILVFLTVVVMYLTWREAKKASELQSLPLLSIYFRGKLFEDRKIRIRNIGRSPAYSVKLESFTFIAQDVQRFWKLDFSLRGTNLIIPEEERDMSLTATANGVKASMEEFLLFFLDPEEDHNRKRMGLILTYKNSEGITYYSQVETGKGGLFIKGAKKLGLIGQIYMFRRNIMESLVILFWKVRWSFGKSKLNNIYE